MGNNIESGDRLPQGSLPPGVRTELYRRIRRGRWQWLCPDGITETIATQLMLETWGPEIVKKLEEKAKKPFLTRRKYKRKNIKGKI